MVDDLGVFYSKYMLVLLDVLEGRTKKDQRTAGTAFSKVSPRGGLLGNTFEKAVPTVLWSLSVLFHKTLCLPLAFH